MAFSRVGFPGSREAFSHPCGRLQKRQMPSTEGGAPRPRPPTPCQPAAGPAHACSPPPASPPRPEGSAGFPLSAVCKGQLLSPGRGAGPPPPEGPGPAGRCGPAAGASGGAFGQEGERRKVCFWEGAETQAAPRGCAVFTWMARAPAQFSEL